MARHCGYCGQRGHNRRTCRDVRLAHERNLRALQQQLEDATPGGDREEYITRRINATGKAVLAVESDTVTLAAVPVVSWLSVATLAAATVPEDMLEPFRVVRLAPLPENTVAVTVPVLGL